MDLRPVSSSNIDQVGYDPSTETMQVVFQNGSVYEYRGVPQGEYDAFISAPSLGSYLNRNIRNNYAYEKIG